MRYVAQQQAKQYALSRAHKFNYLTPRTTATFTVKHLQRP